MTPHFALTALFFLALLISPVSADPAYSVHVAPSAGVWEKKGAEDLASYVGRMTGSEVSVSHLAPIDDGGTQLVVGTLALKLAPELAGKLKAVTPANPILRADAIVISKKGNRIFLAGSNDDSHYFAVSAFLHKQGCRWYTPTEFGAFVPRRESLVTDGIDTAYAPPFEVRTYWIAWNGDSTDYETFGHRNFYNLDRSVAGTHALDGLLPKPSAGESLILNAPATVQAVADALEPKQSTSKPFSLGIGDSVQALKSDIDKRISGGFRDKYFYSTAASDVFMPFYNAVCQELWKRHPESTSKVGFLAYANLTLPPQRQIVAAKPLIAFLAPIDIDPNHALGDPRSPSRVDLNDALERWVQVMQGRIILYDYDQSMLVWRDLPNPSHQVMARDVKRYRDLGILGFATESRNAIATTFTNIFFRGQLYWDPDFDVNGELALFYANFYGSAQQAMADYWGQIYGAWDATTSVDHEFFTIPSIYTPELVQKLERSLQAAEASTGTNDRLKFTRLSFTVLKEYVAMTTAAASECDYAEAVRHGQLGLAAREALTTMNGIFTTYRRMPENGAAWWPGEVEYFAQLLSLTDGSQGKLLTKTPREWYFRPDPHDQGLWRGWGFSDSFSGWHSMRTDLMPRDQGLLDSEHYTPEGYAWYACQVTLPAKTDPRNLRLMFPGLFNTSWLYLNGNLVDWRSQKLPWWVNDYTFSWDADTAAALRPGLNTIVLRTEMHQHPSGIFRRPFLYRRSVSAKP